MNETYYDVPQPNEVGKRDREDGMGAYLMMFASTAIGLPLPIINSLAAIIYYFTNRKKSPYVHFHSLQSLLSQIPTSILNAILIFWSVRIWFMESLSYNDYFKGYLIATIVANVIYFIFSLIAAMRAYKGRMYYMILFGPIAYNVAFRKRAEKQFVNKPPTL